MASDKKKQKKIILIAIGVMCLIGIVSVLFLYVFPDTLETGNDEAPPAGEYEFYPVDYDVDIDSVAAYRELNRLLSFTRGAETFGFTFDDAKEYGDDAVFFANYFSCIINGESGDYDSFFTDGYLDSRESKGSFTKQMIYDISVEKLSEKDMGEKVLYTYNVSYKIFMNNGTFRDDVPSDKARIQYFEVIEDNGKFLIDRIAYYKD